MNRKNKNNTDDDFNGEERIYTTSINCIKIKQFFNNLREKFVECYNSVKSCNPYIVFPCLVDRDIFIDLERGYNGRCSENYGGDSGAGLGGAGLGGAGLGGAGRDGADALDEKKNKLLCKNCKKSEADVVILPCGHGNWCNNCLEEWYETSEKCPECDVVMTDVVQCI